MRLISVFISQQNVCSVLYVYNSTLNTVFCTAVWLEGANIRIACCAIWLVATVWSSFPLFGWGEYVPEPYGLSCTIAWRGYHTSKKDAFYVICSFACFTLVPVLLIVVSQCQILCKVSRFSYSLSARGIRNNLLQTEKRLSMVSEGQSNSYIVPELKSWDIRLSFGSVLSHINEKWTSTRLHIYFLLWLDFQKSWLDLRLNKHTDWRLHVTLNGQNLRKLHLRFKAKIYLPDNSSLYKLNQNKKWCNHLY